MFSSKTKSFFPLQIVYQPRILVDPTDPLNSAWSIPCGSDLLADLVDPAQEYVFGTPEEAWEDALNYLSYDVADPEDPRAAEKISREFDKMVIAATITTYLRHSGNKNNLIQQCVNNNKNQKSHTVESRD